MPDCSNSLAYSDRIIASLCKARPSLVGKNFGWKDVLISNRDLGETSMAYQIFTPFRAEGLRKGKGVSCCCVLSAWARWIGGRMDP
ncbi:uncharacterized protein ARMOST_19682 [Armillaria ostoyae]|uniref:Uncharacterized protein n=1 Tax=Armillaria ostoyae TaxID=47428 RepID=A0A284S590_ARMOS|nr:uncharacterized protein ARMOST_19682 [Armillaria ostoyae]